MNLRYKESKDVRELVLHQGHNIKEKDKVLVDEDGITNQDWMDRGAAAILSMAHDACLRDFIKTAMKEWGFTTKESLSSLDKYDTEKLMPYLEE
mgnify:CR=1 FL=1